MEILCAPNWKTRLHMFANCQPKVPADITECVWVRGVSK
jgi:hypothetical protein